MFITHAQVFKNQTILYKAQNYSLKSLSVFVFMSIIDGEIIETNYRLVKNQLKKVSIFHFYSVIFC